MWINYQSIVILANDECEKAFGVQLATQSHVISYNINSDYGMTYQIPGELSQVFTHCGYTVSYSETIYTKQDSTGTRIPLNSTKYTVSSTGLFTINVDAENSPTITEADH